jgi:CBS domain-containing protein
MLVKEAMTHWAEVIGPDETLQAAARKMRSLGVGALPVCEGNLLVGIITDRDVVVRSTAEAQDPARATVRTAMTPHVVSCCEDDPIEDAARAMGRRAIRRLVVLDSSKRLVGLLSVEDLAAAAGWLTADVITCSCNPGRLSLRRRWQHIA